MTIRYGPGVSADTSELVLAQAMVGRATARVGRGILRVESDGLVEVLDGTLVLAQAIVGEATVVVGHGILRVQLNGLV